MKMKVMMKDRNISEPATSQHIRLAEWEEGATPLLDLVVPNSELKCASNLGTVNKSALVVLRVI